MDMSSLKSYIHGHRAYLGLCKGTQFDDGSSSAYVFDYNLLGVNLERNAPGTNGSSVPVTSKDGVMEDLPF